MPPTQGRRPHDDLYRRLSKPTAAEWRGIMRELLGYRAYEPSNRELIDADPGCKARRYEDGAFDASQTCNRDAMPVPFDGFADALTHVKEVR